MEVCARLERLEEVFAGWVFLAVVNNRMGRKIGEAIMWIMFMVE